MYAVVYVICKSFMSLCWRLLPSFVVMFLGGWTFFQIQYGASKMWLVLPLALLGVIVWWLKQSSADRAE